MLLTSIDVNGIVQLSFKQAKALEEDWARSLLKRLCGLRMHVLDTT